jgi:N4-gp56 family major capsid protein
MGASPDLAALSRRNPPPHFQLKEPSMATTLIGVNDANAVKLWAKRLAYDIVYRTDISPLIGDDENSIIQMKSDTAKGAGDQVTFSLMKKLAGDGFTENEVAQGNGESLSLYTDAILINELGHVVGIPNKGRSIDAQRTLLDLRSAGRRGLKTWWGERMSVSFFNQVCGYTPQSNLKYTGNNAVIAPTSTRRIVVRAAGPTVSTTDEAITSADTFTLSYVDYARELAETVGSPIHPINITGVEGGNDIMGLKYVMYLHPYQVTDLRASTSTGQWLDIQKAAMMGGKISNNPIYTDALGEYNNVILRKSPHVTQGVNSSTGAAITTVRRAVLVGGQAAAIAFGQDMSDSDFNWNEELFDHKRKMEISVMTIWGLKKTVFASTDANTVVVSSYAAKHTA